MDSVPADIVAKLNQAVNAAANGKEIQEKFAAIGFTAEAGSRVGASRPQARESLSMRPSLPVP